MSNSKNAVFSRRNKILSSEITEKIAEMGIDVNKVVELTQEYYRKKLESFGEVEKQRVIKAFQSTKVHDLGKENEYTTESFVDDFKGRKESREEIEKLFEAAKARELQLLDSNINACMGDALEVGIWALVKDKFEKLTSDNIGIGMLAPHSIQEYNSSLSLHIKEAVMAKIIVEKMSKENLNSGIHDYIKTAYLSGMNEILGEKTGALDVNVKDIMALDNELQKDFTNRLKFLFTEANLCERYRVSSAEEMILCRYIGALRKYIQKGIMVGLLKMDEKEADEVALNLPF